MRFTITLASENQTILLPVQYNELLQAAIYRSLSPQFGTFLHDQGYVVDNRRFALFTFSRLIGSYEILRERQQIRFASPIKLVVSSPVHEFVKDMAQLILREGFRIGNQHLRVVSVEMEQPKVEGERITVKTLSPIVAYSTLLRADGKKYTLYFEPGESDFARIVAENLARKGRLLYGEDDVFSPVELEPVGTHKRHIVMYKGNVIKGYSGRFRLSGDQRLLEAALGAGLGSKNSMGFGLVELVGAALNV